MNQIKEIADFLRKSKKAFICGHIMPDGDSVGSVLAMGYLLRELGVEPFIVASDTIPAMYNFLPGREKVITPDKLPDDCDIGVILDCTDPGRLGSELEEYIKSLPALVNIDHHISNQEFGTLNLVDAKAAATGEIVFEIAKTMGITVTHDIAVNLYTAIVMDTGSFRFDNTTDKTHNIAAELIKTGIDVANINKNLFERKDPIQLSLLGCALADLKTAADGRVAWVTIPIKLMRQLGAQDEHADGIINYPRMLEGVEIGLLFREVEPDRFKVGFRSGKLVDVNKLASGFGGGGHPRAAGCMIEGKREEVEKKVIEHCVNALTVNR